MTLLVLGFEHTHQLVLLSMTEAMLFSLGHRKQVEAIIVPMAERQYLDEIQVDIFTLQVSHCKHGFYADLCQAPLLPTNTAAQGTIIAAQPMRKRIPEIAVRLRRPCPF